MNGMKLGLSTVAVAAIAAAPVGAQVVGDLEDGRWLPFLGCWVEVEPAGAPMTCVVPEGPGVAFLSVAGGEVTERRRVVADGAARPAAVAGCTGTEAAAFSPDGRRVYTDADLACGGVERATRGLMAMVTMDEWIEARALGVEQGSVAWVKRYRPAPATRVEAADLPAWLAAETPRAQVSARAAAAAPVTVSALIEAHARTDAEAVRAWIVEQGDPIALDANALVRLADAGVPADVIDVAVAVSYPDRFAVGRAPARTEAGDRYARDRWSRWGGFFGPYGSYYWDPYYYRYNSFYRGYGYGFGGYGYYGYRPTVVVVRPVDNSPRGRVVKGRGYTRGTSGTAAASPRSFRGPSQPSSARAGSGYKGTSSSSGKSKGKAKPRGSGG